MIEALQTLAWSGKQRVAAYSNALNRYKSCLDQVLPPAQKAPLLASSDIVDGTTGSAESIIQNIAKYLPGKQQPSSRRILEYLLGKADFDLTEDLE